MNKFFGLCILLVSLSLLAFTGCSDNDSRAEQDADAPKVGAEAERSDIVITTELKAKITDDELLDGSDVSVTTNNGIVTLTGTVNNDAQAQRAIEIANNTEGVVSVDSQLKVDPEMGSLEEQSEEIGREAKEKSGDVLEETGEAVADARITSEIKLKFAADDTVEALNIDVDTENGNVTLRGDVNNKAEMKKAVQLAKAVDGVKNVNSELRIANQ